MVYYDFKSFHTAKRYITRVRSALVLKITGKYKLDFFSQNLDPLIRNNLCPKNIHSRIKSIVFYSRVMAILTRMNSVTRLRLVTQNHPAR
jgi:hypothetical protein